jgi:nucleosome binding factor SPN SPT16 subunit
LNAKNERVLRAGQVFNVVLGVAGLTRDDTDDARAKTYALQVRTRPFCTGGAGWGGVG